MIFFFFYTGNGYLFTKKKSLIAYINAIAAQERENRSTALIFFCFIFLNLNWSYLRKIQIEKRHTIAKILDGVKFAGS